MGAPTPERQTSHDTSAVNQDSPANPAARFLASALLLYALIWFAPLDFRDLFGTDEGRYAEIPREMLASDDWITPRLDGLKYFEKPPLQYWMTGLAFQAFGLHEWTARLWGAATAFLGVLLTWYTARTLWGGRAALCAAAVQASALFYVMMGQLNTLDMGLSFFLQVALSGLVWLAVAPGRGPGRAVTVVALGAGAALAVLSKGLVGLLIPGAVACLYALVRRDAPFIWRARPWWIALIVLAIAAPWFVLVAQRNPEFARFFFIREHFERFLTREHRRYEPWWYFLPFVAFGIIPWLTLWPRLVREAWRRIRGEDSATLLLVIWVLFTLVFFSASQSKLPPYVLPLLPAVALLMGRVLAEIRPQDFVRHAAAMGVVFAMAALVFVASPALPLTSHLVRGPETMHFVQIMGAASALAAAACLLARHLARRDRNLAAILTLALGGLVFGQAANASQDLLSFRRSMAGLAANMSPFIHADTRVYCVEDYPQTLTFYLQRTCTLVSYRGELDFGIRQEPSRWIDTVDSFVAQWERERDAVAVLTPATYERLRAAGVAMERIADGINAVAVRRP
jgi:4-amino-4-deoxy-L-arabinose transferase-like glycosyltransferase